MRILFFAVVAAIFLAGGAALWALFALADGDGQGGNPAPGVVLVRPDSPSQGPADARVTLVEFFDPECESCRTMYPVVKRLQREYDGRMRLVIRYMPLHRNSAYAAAALEAAGEQRRYWEMLEILLATQPEWGDHRMPRPELIPTYAARLGLDMDTFMRSIGADTHKAKIERDQADGIQAGVSGTPTFFVNGKMLQRLGYEPLKAMIEEALAR
ncbi:MAG: DsbA family protein [Betaproteobacteria bacterium]